MLSGLLWHRATLAKSAATKLNRMICAVNANANRAFLFLLFFLLVLLILESTIFKREHTQEREPKLLLLLWSRKIRLQVFLSALSLGHEANAVVFRNCTDQPFLMHITPTGKRHHGLGLAVSL